VLGTRSVKDKFYGNYPASKLILWGYANFDNSKITAANKVMFKCPSDDSYDSQITLISYYDAVFANDKPTAAARYNYNKVQAPAKLTTWFDQHVQLGTLLSNHPKTVNAVYMDGHVKSINLPAGKSFNVETQAGDGWNYLDNAKF
jgi:prepilin-type processing-associated H-X9-DG protein